MNIGKCGWICGIFLLMFWLLSSSVLPSDDKLSRQSLRNLEAVHISIERIDPQVQREGLTEKAVENLVRARLQQNGISILTRGQWLAEPGNPFLYVHANVLKLSASNEYIYSVRVALKQTVYPVRGTMEIIGAATWSAGGSIGITPSLEKIRTSILKQVDRFVAAYRVMNPR
jgi:hypothetical protein